MGLDMSIYKYNKQMNEETFNKFYEAKKYDSDSDERTERIKDIVEQVNGDYNSEILFDFYRNECSEGYANFVLEQPISEIEFMQRKKQANLKDTYKEYYDFITPLLDERRKIAFGELMAYIDKQESRKQAYNEMKDLIEELGESKEIAYWRKHSDLNGYMSNMYYDRGGQEDSFNCIPLLLSKEDIEKIIIDHKAHLDKNNIFKVEEARGFFWGQSDISNWEQSLEDFERILKETDWDNSTIYYHCWW